jgi:hypothetical protein
MTQHLLDQTRAKRLALLENLAATLTPDGSYLHVPLDEFLDDLDRIDAERLSSKKNPFYAMLNQLDADTRLLLQAQGDPVETRAAIDRLVSHLMGYAEKMGEG